MRTDQPRLQAAILRMLHEGIDNRPNNEYFMAAVRERFQESEISDFDVMEATWALIARRLAYIDGRQTASENWKLLVTAAGREVAAGREPNPDVPHEYLGTIRINVPSVDDIVLDYLSDALKTYTECSYRPSVLMLGVASEAAFIQVAHAVAIALSRSGRGGEGQKLQALLDRPRTTASHLFEETRRRIDVSAIPTTIRTDMKMALDFTSDVLRQARNEAGHPSGQHFDRETARARLFVFPHYLRKLYELKAYCEDPKTVL